jgi:cytochrome P450
MKSLNGASFALIEATVVLATLLRGFAFGLFPALKRDPLRAAPAAGRMPLFVESR